MPALSSRIPFRDKKSSRYRRKADVFRAFALNSQSVSLVRFLRYSVGEHMATEISKRLFTVDDYYRMAEVGILRPNDRVELIRGEVIAMSPIGRLHGAAVVRATNALVPLVTKHALVSAQGVVRLDQYDEPQPDIALLRLKDDCYRSGHAGPNDVLLIIEMADSSLKYDREIKGPLYAETGVAEYWIADIQNDCLWAFSDIQNKSYSVTRQFRRGESIEPKLLAGCRIPVDVLLP